MNSRSVKHAFTQFSRLELSAAMGQKKKGPAKGVTGPTSGEPEKDPPGVTGRESGVEPPGGSPSARGQPGARTLEPAPADMSESSDALERRVLSDERDVGLQPVSYWLRQYEARSAVWLRRSEINETSEGGEP